MPSPGIQSTDLQIFERGNRTSKQDIVAMEEPLEIRIGYGSDERHQKQIAVTMRTPGHDFELALGFLFSEGIINASEDVESVHYCENVKDEEVENVVRVELAKHVRPEFESLERNFYTTSSCGVCGKASIDSIHVTCSGLKDSFKVTRDALYTMPDLLKKKQLIYGVTGGLHATGIVDAEGTLSVLREDIGRHNALDKVIGAAFLKKNLPIHDKVAILSGRAGFELVQKAIRAQIPVVASVGAPSSLAIQLAKEFNLTLIGFLKENRFNVYAGSDRIV